MLQDSSPASSFQPIQLPSRLNTHRWGSWLLPNVSLAFPSGLLPPDWPSHMPPRGVPVSGHFLLPHATLIPLKTAHGNLSRPSPFRAAWAPSSEPGLKHPGLIKLRVCVWSVCSSRSAAFTKPFHIFSHESYKADRAVNVSSIYKWVNWDLKSSNLLKLKQFAQSHSIGTRNAWTRQQFFWF